MHHRNSQTYNLHRWLVLWIERQRKRSKFRGKREGKVARVWLISCLCCFETWKEDNTELLKSMLYEQRWVRYERKYFNTCKVTMYKSSLSLLAGFTSSGTTALKNNTWFREISVWTYYSGKVFIHKGGTKRVRVVWKMLLKIFIESSSSRPDGTSQWREITLTMEERLSEEQWHIVHQISLEINKWSSGEGGKCGWF